MHGTMMTGQPHYLCAESVATRSCTETQQRVSIASQGNKSVHETAQGQLRKPLLKLHSTRKIVGAIRSRKTT
jgi:hypothetical protein